MLKMVSVGSDGLSFAGIYALHGIALACWMKSLCRVFIRTSGFRESWLEQMSVTTTGTHLVF